jgi:uncharacterized protein
MNTIETQKILKWGGVVLIVLAVFLVVKTLDAFKDLKENDPAYNSISVTGEGEAISIPDVATFSFTVSADAQTVSDAQEQVTKKMDAILAGLDAMGIEDRDIKTTGYSVSPKYTYESQICPFPAYCPPGKQVQDGFNVNHNITLKIRKTGDAGRALSLVGEKGATNLSGITFTLDDPDQVLNEARALAIKDAQAKAKMLSKELGVRLKRVVSYYDNTRGNQPYYAEGLGGDSVRTTSVSPSIPIGENKVIMNVTIIYEIK